MSLKYEPSSEQVYGLLLMVHTETTFIVLFAPHSGTSLIRNATLQGYLAHKKHTTLQGYLAHKKHLGTQVYGLLLMVHTETTFILEP